MTDEFFACFVELQTLVERCLRAQEKLIAENERLRGIRAAERPKLEVIREKQVDRKRRHRVHVTPQMVESMHQLKRLGRSDVEIASVFGVHQETVRRRTRE